LLGEHITAPDPLVLICPETGVLTNLSAMMVTCPSKPQVRAEFSLGRRIVLASSVATPTRKA